MNGLTTPSKRDETPIPFLLPFLGLKRVGRIKPQSFLSPRLTAREEDVPGLPQMFRTSCAARSGKGEPKRFREQCDLAAFEIFLDTCEVSGCDFCLCLSMQLMICPEISCGICV